MSFFSGRTNPQFIVKDNQELTEKMLHAREKGWFRLPEQMPFRLGYRGILVEDKDTKFWGLLVGKESAKLQRELLKSVQLKEDDRVEIDKDIELIHFEEAQTFEVRGKRFAPRYTPGHWNPVEALYKRQRCNNCYNYANIRATDNRAQPGFASGQVYTVDANGWTMADPYTADNVKAAALRDGLLELNPYPAIADPVPGPPDEIFKHLVALVVRPGM